MADDPLYAGGRHRIAVIDAAISQAQADLQAHVVNGDIEAIGEAEQAIANLRADRQNMFNLHAEHVRSQTPPPPLTLEERRAKPWEKMDYSDVWEMSKSKYGPPDEAMFRAGINEAAKRRSRGE
jgi:hypothetical protein